jgi:hypothetical protein
MVFVWHLLGRGSSYLSFKVGWMFFVCHPKISHRSGLHHTLGSVRSGLHHTLGNVRSGLHHTLGNARSGFHHTLLVLLESFWCIGLHQGGFVMFTLGCKRDHMSHTRPFGIAFWIIFWIVLLLKCFIKFFRKNLLKSWYF